MGLTNSQAATKFEHSERTAISKRAASWSWFMPLMRAGSVSAAERADRSGSRRTCEDSESVRCRDTISTTDPRNEDAVPRRTHPSTLLHQMIIRKWRTDLTPSSDKSGLGFSSNVTRALWIHQKAIGSHGRSSREPLGPHNLCGKKIGRFN